MKANCLTRALDQWNENREYQLWYNGNHVISLEKQYNGRDLTIMRWLEPDYMPLNHFGLYYFWGSFSLAPKYIRLLTEYLETE